MGEMKGFNTASGGEREVRIALVLYGGISLAIYENGVTRSFFELVKGKGIFDLLLKLLDANAVVDVIAGASAGGINGLLLAACLEAGSDFANTAQLWRMHGDLGDLMRPTSEAESAESLLDGDGYYQQKLEEAFTSIFENGNPKEAGKSEMDVFITGTDLAGYIKSVKDSLGQPIVERDHRVVFQLKYRPGRRYLGLGRDKKKLDDRVKMNTSGPARELLEEQATILASISRITSTFPAAFPPFRLAQVGE